MQGLLMYQRCMFGNHDLVLKEVDPQLVEHAFGRIKVIRGRDVTVMDEPFVSKAVENYFTAIDPYFAREVRKHMVKSTAIEQGCVSERFMMRVFSETFNTRSLSEWPHQPPLSLICVQLSLARWKMLAGGNLDSSKAQLTRRCRWRSSWTLMSIKGQPEQHACRAIFLPQVQAVGTSLGFLHPDRQEKDSTSFCPDEIASRVLQLL
ncbi:MAG: hypothetical protein J3R72DRAFT_12298 [Linnemannia gamsii]|nr:MAG: hypothetical protein J3R72DRAFT_12298 [Linnemannia gamsii]